MISQIAGIVLAAGVGRRMGQTKQLLKYRGRYLLETVVSVAEKSNLACVVVVLGHDAERILRKVKFSRSKVVINQHFEKGQGSSLTVGLSEVRDVCHGAMFILADQPLIHENIINRLIESYRWGKKSIVVPTFRLVKGPPVIFDSYFFPELSRLSGDFGGRFLISRYQSSVVEVQIESSFLFVDIDTPKDYNALHQLKNY